MMSIGESVSTDCMMGTATYAAFTTYTKTPGMSPFGGFGPSDCLTLVFLIFIKNSSHQICYTYIFKFQ